MASVIHGVHQMDAFMNEPNFVIKKIHWSVFTSQFHKAIIEGPPKSRMLVETTSGYPFKRYFSIMKSIRKDVQLTRAISGE
ncbi:unnamed protein product [Sphenostylis stenocarpa]|uniref:Uncharacterized protein n=1 Tax=Sphenostylis stenocarpa TaxID=92480 RepID=A0AA86W6D7_9FABA|nr:unnamed protein product [Sphenostylis stenocarpa]